MITEHPSHWSKRYALARNIHDNGRYIGVVWYTMPGRSRHGWKNSLSSLLFDTKEDAIAHLVKRARGRQ